MTKLPVISAKKAIAVLERIGYKVDHQTGSHIILRNYKYPYRRLTIPNHKSLAKGTLRGIIKQAGLTKDEFADLI